MQKIPEFNTFQQITKGLFIGPQTSMMQIEKLKANGITQILKVNEATRALFPMKRYGIDVKQIAMEDNKDYEIDVKSEIDPCLEYIQQGIQRNEGTLVVCTAGMSRSATVCIAYLMKHQNLTF